MAGLRAEETGGNKGIDVRADGVVSGSAEPAAVEIAAVAYRPAPCPHHRGRRMPAPARPVTGNRRSGRSGRIGSASSSDRNSRGTTPTVSRAPEQERRRMRAPHDPPSGTGGLSPSFRSDLQSALKEARCQGRQDTERADGAERRRPGALSRSLIRFGTKRNGASVRGGGREGIRMDAVASTPAATGLPCEDAPSSKGTRHRSLPYGLRPCPGEMDVAHIVGGRLSAISTNKPAVTATRWSPPPLQPLLVPASAKLGSENA